MARIRCKSHGATFLTRAVKRFSDVAQPRPTGKEGGELDMVLATPWFSDPENNFPSLLEAHGSIPIPVPGHIPRLCKMIQDEAIGGETNSIPRPRIAFEYRNKFLLHFAAETRLPHFQDGDISIIWQGKAQ